MNGGSDPLNGNQKAIISTTTIMITLSTLSFLLRLFARRQVGAKLWWDDYSAAIALIFSYGPNVLALTALRFGLGRHLADLGHEPVEPVETTMLLVYFNELTRQFTLPFVKFSLLLLYHRLFQSPGIRRVSIAIAIWVTCQLIAATFIQIFACHPVQFFWHQLSPGAHGQCINYNKFWVVSAALNTATDFIVFFVPLPVVWRLEMTKRRRINLSVVFVIGCFACAASIVRIELLQQPSRTHDFTWDATVTALWTCIEVSTASISCNIPATTSVFVRIVRWLRRRTGSSSGAGHGHVMAQRPRARFTKFTGTPHLQRQIYGLGSLGLELGHVTEIRGGRGSMELTSSGLSLVEGGAVPGSISVRHELRIDEIDLKEHQ